MRTGFRKAAALCAMAAMGTVVAACGSSSHTTTPKATTAPKTTTAPTTAKIPQVSINSFTRTFSAMTELKSVAASGKGLIGVILPDTVSSARYTEFDAPYLKKAMRMAGVPSSDIKVENAQGSDSTELTDAESDITAGARVLIMDPLDSGVGAQIESYAKAHGVKVIDYDRLTLGGSRAYYDSFNNVEVGTLIGKGLVSCVADWKVSKPQVIVMHGAATDNNATLFAQGYNAVIDPYFKSGKWDLVTRTAGTWDPPTTETEFQQAYTAHRHANAAVLANDETAAPVVNYLKTLHIKARTFPITGQDATLVGLQNILSGYQCGTVYKPIYEEAQAAVALALYLRAGDVPPKSLVNGTTEDTTSHKAVASVLLTPEWVTTKNMNATVIADGFVPASQLCTGTYKAECSAAGIKP